MKTKITTLIICIVLLISCDDNTATSEQTQEGIQTQEINQTESQTEEQTIEESVKSVSGVEYDIATMYLKLGYQPFSDNYYQSTDFDNDGTRDFAVVVFKSESKEYQDEPLTLQIYKQRKDKNFELVSESGSIQDIVWLAGSSLDLKKNVISIKKGEMRWDHEWKFRYDKKYDDYVLIGSEYNSYGNATNDGSGNRSTNYLSGKRIEKFNEFDYENEELIELDPVTTKIPSTKEKPLFLKDFNQESCFDL